MWNGSFPSIQHWWFFLHSTIFCLPRFILSLVTTAIYYPSVASALSQTLVREVVILRTEALGNSNLNYSGDFELENLHVLGPLLQFQILFPLNHLTFLRMTFIHKMTFSVRRILTPQESCLFYFSNLFGILITGPKVFFFIFWENEVIFFALWFFFFEILVHWFYGHCWQFISTFSLRTLVLL